MLVKDESERLGLPSFKILGTSWAVHRLFAEGGDAAVLVSACAAAVAVQDLAFHGVTAGPCGAASLASARLELSVGQRRAQLSITSDSVVVLLSSEGSTANPNGEAP